MERDEIRFECLKLASGRSPNLQEVLAQAREFVGFVNDQEQIKPQEKKVVVDTKKSTK